MRFRSDVRLVFASCSRAPTRIKVAPLVFVLMLLIGGVAQVIRAQVQEKSPRLMYKNEDENELYITLPGTDELAKWDTQNDEVEELISLVDGNGNTCEDVRSVVYTEPGYYWVACFASNEVWVLDDATNGVVEKVGGIEGGWEMDHSSTSSHNWVVVSAWGGETGDWAPSQPGDRSGTVTLLEATPEDEDFGTRVPESELPGVAPNPIEIPSPGDGGPWGTAACEGIFWITNDGADETVKLTLDPFSLEIFDKGELPWEVDCRVDPEGPMRVVIANGGDDDPPQGGTETVTIDGPMRDRNGDPVETSFTTFHGTANPNACWNTIFDSWSDHQKDKYFNHTNLPWYNQENPPSGAADLKRKRTGAASFTIVTIFRNGECEYKSIPVGEGQAPDKVEPWGTEIGPDSKVYLVDMHKDLTREYDPSTESITEFQNQCYTAPRDIAVMNDKLYVANMGKHTISSQENGTPNDYDYSGGDNGPSGGLEWFDLEEGSHQGCNALPVDLAQFDATLDGERSVRLSWQTASEQDNAGFRVQHRASGGETWQNLGFVESRASEGTTSKAQSYQFDVEDLSVGTHRFRLEQVDLDGTTEFSEVVHARVRMQASLRLTPPRPNPARSTATLRFGVREAQQARVTVFDALGRRVRTLYRGTPTPGRMRRVRVRTEGLPSGTYLIRLAVGEQTRTERLTVLR